MYLYLFAVALLCCDMLWYSCAVTCCGTAVLGNAGKISFTDLLPDMLCSHALIIISLPGFLYFYTCSINVSLHQIIISINFPLIYVIWWASIQITRWMAEMQIFLYHTHTHTHTEARMTSQWGHKHMNKISRTAPRVTSWAFHHFVWVTISSYHIHTEM